MGISADENGWISYRCRSDWKDVAPIYLSDEEKAFVNIACSEKFSEIFAYFRAVFQSQEKSKRVLELTKDAVMMNPANYTVWHHRHLLVESLNDPGQELSFTARILHDDAKNYHAWQHRQWVVKVFKLWNDELAFCNHLIQEDIRNNSAWNYRYFVISSTTGYTREALEHEIKLTLELIKKAPHNESSWNYLSGIMEHAEGQDYESIITSCEEMRKQGVQSSYLLSFIFDYWVDKMEETKDKSHIDHIKKIYEELVKMDPIRKEYWQYTLTSIT
ncbi:unnamed protein product [Soboliphyme baturini]|uniref:Protein farnesyltransferase/geranylgeranyltransferase type-1 subunit alpha n=1 Tax=Soboliphyme baturini TaxID=241478 RepID=A0A183I8R5_9BILA|nr:unnamed protein product [Soboliphyme baturini]